MATADLRKYAVQVMATNSIVWREVIRVYTKAVADQCAAEYSKDIPAAQFRVVELW